MFNKGIAFQDNGCIAAGGQTPPINIEGDKLKWKNAQKNEKKNITSEVINNAIANNIFCCTLKVWWPSKVASVTISENHKYRLKDNKIKLNIRWNPPFTKKWKYDTILKVKDNADTAVNNGQGLGSTKWKGCCSWVLILIFFNSFIVFWRRLKIQKIW